MTVNMPKLDPHENAEKNINRTRPKQSLRPVTKRQAIGWTTKPTAISVIDRNNRK